MQGLHIKGRAAAAAGDLPFTGRNFCPFNCGIEGQGIMIGVTVELEISLRAENRLLCILPVNIVPATFDIKFKRFPGPVDSAAAIDLAR